MRVSVVNLLTFQFRPVLDVYEPDNGDCPLNGERVLELHGQRGFGIGSQGSCVLSCYEVP